jgi:Tol biopolymer transport system component
MSSILGSLSRRQFFRQTAGAGATMTVGTALMKNAKAQAQHPAAAPPGTGPTGKKGQTYPSQKKSHRDPKSGATVWQLTDTPGRTTQTPYYTNRHATRDSRWLLYASDRANQPEHFDYFKMDLKTGESVQLTDSGNIVPHSIDISYDGKSAYYCAGLSIRVIDLESFKERELTKLDESAHETHAMTVTPDNKSLIVAPTFGKSLKVGYEFADTAVRSALVLIDTASGKERRLIDGNALLGHVAFSPTDSNLVLYSIHYHWRDIQRPWLINADGSNNRPIFLQRSGEGVGHEHWGGSGKTVFATCYRGRQPQGIWAVEIDGSNERCVLAGSNIAHSSANNEEDRFVADEVFLDTSSLWMSKKGSSEPKVLCKMAADWFKMKDGVFDATRHHPHEHFLPNGQGVTFSSDGEIYLVEV